MRLLERAQNQTKEFALSSLHLLFPPTCSLCERELERTAENRAFTCSDCIDSVEELEAPWCDQCGDPIETSEVDLCETCAHSDRGFELCRSYGIYDGSLARLIQRFKYEKERALVNDLVPLLTKLIANEHLQESFEAITFVPMRSKRQHKRGFNQAELLARSLGKKMRMPVVRSLKKIRETRSQMELSGEERRTNLAGAFKAINTNLPSSMLIIDDVFTTGSTLSECSHALIEAGVERVIALTLARAPLSDHTEE